MDLRNRVPRNNHFQLVFGISSLIKNGRERRYCWGCTNHHIFIRHGYNGWRLSAWLHAAGQTLVSSQLPLPLLWRQRSDLCPDTHSICGNLEHQILHRFRTGALKAAGGPLSLQPAHSPGRPLRLQIGEHLPPAHLPLGLKHPQVHDRMRKRSLVRP